MKSVRAKRRSVCWCRMCRPSRGERHDLYHIRKDVLRANLNAVEQGAFARSR